MRRYSQTTLLHPGRTLAVWLLVTAAGAIAATLVPGVHVASSADPIVRDLPTVAGCAAAVLVVATWLVLRSWQGVVGTLLVVLATLAVTAGAMSVLGGKLTGPAGAGAVIAGLLAMQACALVGLAHRVRVNVERHRGRPLPRDKVYLVSEALRDARPAVVWSAVAAMALFGALDAAAPGEVGRMAGYLVLAALVSSIGSMMILPAVLALAPADPPDDTDDAVHALVKSVAGRAVALRGVLLVLAVIVVAGGGAAVVALDETPSAGHLSAPGCFAIAIAALGVALGLGFGSIKRAAAALAAILPPALVAYLVLVVPHHALDAVAAIAVAGGLALVAAQTIFVFKDASWRQARDPDHMAAARGAAAARGKPVLLACVLVALGAAPLFAAHDAQLTRAGLAIVGMAATAAVWSLCCVPGLLALLEKTIRKQPRADDWDFIKSFDKVTASEQHTSFSQFTDDEIRHMFVGDFFALVGKTVMRHGGYHGTRRLLTELDIGPNAHVLEIGTGVGTTAFDLVAADPTIRVTSVDLSAFMVETTRRRAAELPGDRSSRLNFVHTTDPNAMPFADNTFDNVIVEAVSSYNDPPKFFREILRVLKPGGRVGMHDWCWTEKPPEDLEVHVCVLACGCNPGDMRFFTQADWEDHFKRCGYDIRFAEQYPFTFFSWGTMADDEGTWGLLKMFARTLSRRAIADRMFRMMFILMRHEGAFGYTITVAQKPAGDRALPPQPEHPDQPAPEPVALQPEAAQ